MDRTLSSFDMGSHHLESPLKVRKFWITGGYGLKFYFDPSQYNNRDVIDVKAPLMTTLAINAGVSKVSLKHASSGCIAVYFKTASADERNLFLVKRFMREYFEKLSVIS